MICPPDHRVLAIYAVPFCWGGKRWERRQRQHERHQQGGSGAYTLRPVRRRWQPSVPLGGKATLRGK